MSNYYSEEQHIGNIREDVLKALRRGSRLIGSTMGPGGRYVTIASPGGAITTKDGVSVARYMNFENQLDNLMAQMIITASQKTVDKVGDGTTTCAVLLTALYEELYKISDVKDGMANVFEVSKGIDLAVESIVDYLKEQSHKVVSKDGVINFDYLTKVATISANNDPKLGEIIARLVRRVGVNGTITVKESGTRETDFEHYKGYAFDTTVLAHHKEGIIEFDDPVFAIVDKTIDNWDVIRDLMESWKDNFRDAKTKKINPLVLIVSDLSGEAKATITANSNRNQPIVVIKAPDFMERRKAMLEDVQFLTKTRQVFSDVTGYVLSRFGEGLAGDTEKEFGHASRFLIKNGKAVILAVKGDGMQESIDKRISDLDKQKDSTDNEYKKAFLTDRISRLSSGMGIIYVGADTPAELKTKLDLVDDSYKACFAALRGGVIGGGGNSLLRAKFALKFNFSDNDNIEQDIGINAVLRAIKQPFYQILRNQHITNSAIDKIVKLQFLNKGKTRKDFFTGFLNGEGMVSLVSRGVIDPLDVTIEALRNSASVVKNLLCTEYIVFTNTRSNMPDLESLMAAAQYMKS